MVKRKNYLGVVSVIFFFFCTTSPFISHSHITFLRYNTSMAATTLTLVCLISGELTSKAFKVRIRDIHADISDLKKAIVGEKPNAFKHIDAKDLMLWQATIPADENAEEESIITLDGLDDKTKLGNPRTCLSKLFPETPDDNTYIIVEQLKGMVVFIWNQKAE